MQNMLQVFRLTFEDKRIWATLGGSVLFSFILAIGVIALDTRTIPILTFFPTWTLTSVNLAKSILTLLAGSLFSVATFTFSTMLTVISLYSSNFSPRTVENFLLHKTSMRTLGIFMGGFIYCIASLFFMRSSQEEYLVLSASVALFYAFACVLYFTKFVYNVANFVQLEKLVYSLYEEADDVVNETIQYFSQYTMIEKLPQLKTTYRYTIHANQHGYVEHIQFEELAKLSQEAEGVLILNLRIGNFLSNNEPIADYYTNRKLQEESDFVEKVNNELTYETEQSTMFDPNFARIKLVEVALRAVSPGINDPNTAIHILRYKALLDAKFAHLKGRYAIIGEKETGSKERENDKKNEKQHEEKLTYKGCVLYNFNDFPKDIHQGYRQLIHYMKEDISGVAALFEALLTIAYSADTQKLEYLKTYSQYLYEMTMPHFPQDLDKQIIEKQHNKILYLAASQYSVSNDSASAEDKHN